MLNFVNGSRKIEDEGERNLARHAQNAHYLLRAGRYVNIGAGDDQVALCEWMRQALLPAQKLHDSAEGLC